MISTKEIQYNELVDDNKIHGAGKLGLTTSHTYRNDPRRLAFLLSRYKFVSKLFDNYSSVLEVGCGDAFGSTLVANNVDKYTGIDFDPIFINNAKELRTELQNTQFIVHDILKSSVSEAFDGIYSLDVLEHINKSDEHLYMINILNSLNDNGSLIVGMPSIESQRYASSQSKIGHVNCKSGDELKEFCLKYFHNVFVFSMNDEVIHTGFYPMAHYIIVLCTNKKENIK